MRLIFVSRGYKLLAVICGFFEVLVWLIAITQIINNLTNPIYYIAYAGGFATGNFVGMFIEEKIAIGNVLIRVITKNEMVKLTEYLKKHNYGVTLFPAQGMYGTVQILFTIIPRMEIESIVSFIKKVNPHAFYTIEDIRFVKEKNDPRKTSLFFRRKIRTGK